MAESLVMMEHNRFTIGFYFQALTRMLGSPGKFFEELPDEIGLWKPFGFLLISSIFFTAMNLLNIHDRPVVIGGILLVNAVAMPFITSALSYIVMTMIVGKRVTYTKLFSVFAFASGVTMLASWIPLFVWITEPWKWFLVVTGMVRGCGLSWLQSILILGLSILILFLFFWSLGPVIFYIKGLGS